MTNVSNLLSLPHDSLVVVSSFLGGQNKSNFSKTCQKARTVVLDQFNHDRGLIASDGKITSFDTFKRTPSDREAPPGSHKFVQRLWSDYMEQLRHLVRSTQGQRLVRKAFRLKENHKGRHSFPMYSIENIKKLELEVFPKLRAQSALNEWKFWRRVIQNEAFDSVRDQIDHTLSEIEGLNDSEKGACFSIFMTDLLAKHPEIAPQIKMLNLSDANLSEIPACISLFFNLEYLDLSENKIAVIPPEIGTLKKLTDILFSNNKIKVLPPEIGELVNLDVLDVNNNLLKAIPPEVNKLIKLKNLYADYNKIAAIPVEIGSLKELLHFFIRNNELKIIPEAISCCEKLERLSLVGNPIKHIHPSVLERDNLKIVT